MTTQWDLSRLLHPGSIAVAGGKFAEAVITQCDLMGYKGEIWPINPGRSDILGRTCYADVASLPGKPDAAFVAVNRHATVDVIGALADVGAGGAVCYASGFSEAGTDGAELQQSLVNAAGDMPVVGPNCYGLINYLDGALLWPDIHGGKRVERGVALLTQSGNMAINLTMQRRGLPVAYIGAMGNQASVGISAMMKALAGDERVTAIGLHIEGIDDFDEFVDAAAFAAEKGVPVVVLKTGASEVGSQLMLTHTASLAGSDEVASALFRRLAIGRVYSIPQMLETLKLLHVFGPLPGSDMLSMSCSGGEASLISDIAEHHGVNFRPFTDEQVRAVSETTNPLVTVTNPFDYHTFDWGDGPRLQKTFAAAMACGFDLSCVVNDYPRGDRCETADWDICIQAIKDARDETGARVGIIASMAENMPEAVAEDLIADNILPFSSIEEALKAVEIAAELGQGKFNRPERHLTTASGPSDISLSEDEAKGLFARHGIAIPCGAVVEDQQSAKAFAAATDGPVVAKAVGRDILHKSEMGAVKLRLTSEADVAGAVTDLLKISDHILVEEMIEGGIAELILGLRVDPIAGFYLTIGLGGVMTELIRDIQILLFPYDAEDVIAALYRLKGATLLTGYRGQPHADIAAVADIAVKMQSIVMADVSLVTEVEINPVIVKQAGQGAVAADAIVRLSEE